jgi:hypothetical protein
MPPAYEPSAVARAIAHVCEHPQRDVVVGLASKMFVLMNRIHPKLIDWMMLSNDAGAKLQTSDRPDTGRDNLTTASRGVQPARGAFGDKWWNLGGSEYTQVFELHPALKYAAIGAAALAAVGLLNWLTGHKIGAGDDRWAGRPDPTSGPVPDPAI